MTRHPFSRLTVFMVLSLSASCDINLFDETECLKNCECTDEKLIALSDWWEDLDFDLDIFFASQFARHFPTNSFGINFLYDSTSRFWLADTLLIGKGRTTIKMRFIPSSANGNPLISTDSMEFQLKTPLDSTFSSILFVNLTDYRTSNGPTMAAGNRIKTYQGPAPITNSLHFFASGITLYSGERRIYEGRIAFTLTRFDAAGSLLYHVKGKQEWLNKIEYADWDECYMYYDTTYHEWRYVQ